MKLGQLLNKPTYIDIKFPDEVEEKIKQWEKDQKKPKTNNLRVQFTHN